MIHIALWVASAIFLTCVGLAFLAAIVSLFKGIGKKNYTYRGHGSYGDPSSYVK